VIHRQTSRRAGCRSLGDCARRGYPPYLIDPNGWFLQGAPEQWKRLETSTIDVLVQLHRIEDDGDDTAFLHWDAPGDTALERQLNAHRAY